MRILHWTELYRPHIGGVEILTEHLIDSLSARGHENFVITSHTSAPLADLEKRGAATVHRFRFQHALSAGDAAEIERLQRAVADLLVELAPDLIHLHTLGPSLLFYEACARGPWPAVLTLHDVPPAAGNRDTLAWRAIARCDAVVAASGATLAALHERMPEAASRSVLIVPGLPWPMRAAPSQELVPTISAAGRLAAEKGFDVLLRAMPAILAEHPDTRLRIAGDGRERAALAALARELGVDGSVDLLGWKPPSAVEAMLGRSHVVAVPSRRPEPFGLVALQAAQLGRPVVASRAGALGDIVADGLTAVVVEPGDAPALASAISALLGDPMRCALLGTAARERAAQFSMPSMVGAYEELFLRLCSQRRQASLPASGRPLIVWEGLQSSYNPLAYGNAALCNALLDSAAVDLRIVSNQRSWSDLDVRPELQRLRTLDSAVAGLPLREAASRSSVWVRHQFPLRGNAPGRFPWVAMQPWEYSLAPVAMVEMLNRCHEVWAPSRFSAQAFRRSGVTVPIAVVPYGVDTARFTPAGDRFALPEDHGFRFLFVGASIFRKGLDVLLAAYARAFDRSDRVALVIKDMGVGSVYEGQASAERVESFAANSSHPRVAYLDGRLPASSLAALYRSCDVFVSPYRGEGFSLPTLEAMASGLPVLVTAGGATDDFVDESVGWRIPSRSRYAGRSVYGQATHDDVYLLEPDVDGLAVLLRHCFEARKEVAEKGGAAATRARAGWTWAHSARRILERIEAVLDARAVARR